MTKNTSPSNRPSPESWDDVLGAFEEDLYRRGRSQATIATYSSALRVFGRFYRDELKKPGPYVSRLSQTDIQAFIDYLRRDRLLTLSSINRFISALRAFSLFLLERHWHRHDIAADLKTYRVPTPGEPPRLSPQDVRRLLTAVDLDGRNGRRDLAILLTLIHCGLRVGELCRLLIDDVTINQTNGRLRVRFDKGRGEHIVPLNASVRRALSAYLDLRGPAPGPSPLFLSERRRALAKQSIQHLVKKYLCAIGRPELSAHDIRHHFALALYEQSGKLTLVQKALGHRSIATTARYVRATEGELEEALEALPSNAYPEPPGLSRDEREQH